MLGRAAVVVAAAGLFAGMIGCDARPRRVPVAGKVLIDGKPLTTGFIMVVPHEGRAATGQIQPDGSFRLTTFDENDGCIPGSHPVTIVANEQITPTRMKWLAPKKYADVASTDRQVTIDRPRDDLIVELTWSGGRPFIETTGDAAADKAAAKATSAGQN